MKSRMYYNAPTKKKKRRDPAFIPVVPEDDDPNIHPMSDVKPGEYAYVKSAKAVWEENDIDGGWIVEIELFDGEVDCLLPPRKWEFAPKETDPEKIVQVTLEMERLKVADG